MKTGGAVFWVKLDTAGVVCGKGGQVQGRLHTEDLSLGSWRFLLSTQLRGWRNMNDMRHKMWYFVIQNSCTFDFPVCLHWCVWGWFDHPQFSQKNRMRRELNRWQGPQWRRNAEVILLQLRTLFKHKTSHIKEDSQLLVSQQLLLVFPCELKKSWRYLCAVARTDVSKDALCLNVLLCVFGQDKSSFAALFYQNTCATMWVVCVWFWLSEQLLFPRCHAITWFSKQNQSMQICCDSFDKSHFSFQWSIFTCAQPFFWRKTVLCEPFVNIHCNAVICVVIWRSWTGELLIAEQFYYVCLQVQTTLCFQIRFTQLWQDLRNIFWVPRNVQGQFPAADKNLHPNTNSEEFCEFECPD